MQTLLQDLRYAFRLLAKSPGFTAIAILTLALGIGANTAIFSVVNAVLLRPLAFRDPSRLVIVAEKSPFPTISTSYQNFVDWRDQSRSFESMEATRGTGLSLTGAGEPELLLARMATAGLFPLLGVEAHIGRTFLPEEDRAGGAPVALLSYGLWQRRFGGSREIIGKPITLAAQPYTVIGVLPAGFQILQPAAISRLQYRHQCGRGRAAGTDGPKRSPRADSSPWRGEPRAPHCVRERGESSARARCLSRQGSGHSNGDGRGTRSRRTPIADGKCSPFARWWFAWIIPGVGLARPASENLRRERPTGNSHRVGPLGSIFHLSRLALRGVLVASEMALAVLLLVGSGLLLRSFSRLQDVPPGFQSDHLLVADIPLSQTAYAKPEQRYQFFDRLVERAKVLPGVRSAGAASFLPVSGGGSIIHFNITGHPPKTPHDYVAAGYRTVTPNYLETLGVPLLQGRLLTPADNEKAPAVVVINATMAKAHFAGENPLGKRIQLGATPDKDVPTMEIVGVVGDVRPGLGVDPQTEMYLPYRQADLVLPVFQLSLVLRTAADPQLQTSALRSALAEIDPNQPLVNVRTMEDNIATTVAQPRFRTWLIGIFAAVALVLAAVGVYGVMSYTVMQRTSEIGIRITLGAQPEDVFKIVVGEGLRLALAGVGAGIVAALAMTRVLQSFLYGVSAYDPPTFLAVALLLTIVAVAASFFPARRATLVDPMVALRYE